MLAAAEQLELPARWEPLEWHPEQARFAYSPARFAIASSGRRSGKTEIAKRWLQQESWELTVPNGWCVFGAPTHDQARRVAWDDLKALTPRALRHRVYERDLTIRLVTGTDIQVLGLDRPERIEGRALDRLVLDEFASMRPTAWKENIYPALSTRGRPGRARLIGVPEGRNHYYELWKKALADTTGEWSAHTWHSADIVPDEARKARLELDELTYRQEYEGEFVSFEGQAYYPFRAELHATTGLEYDPRLPLVLCFDFNVDPGVAAIVQEQRRSETQALAARREVADEFTAVLGEVYIPRNSNTPAVCRKLLQDWGDHPGEVRVYGDRTGGNRGTAKIQGSDWDLVKRDLGAHFRERLRMRVHGRNPAERARINAVNSRLLASDGLARLLVDPQYAPKTVNDFEGVSLLAGGSGEIDKKATPMLTHLTDAVGYYVEQEFPVAKRAASVEIVR